MTTIPSDQKPHSIQQHDIRNVLNVLGTSVMVGVAGLGGVGEIVHADSKKFLRSDEVQLQLTGDYLGLGLSLEVYKDTSNVVVSSVKADAPTECKNIVKPGFILVSVAGQPVERMPLAELAVIVKQSPRPTMLVFRNPTAFVKSLQDAFAGTASETAIGENEVLRVERVAENGGAMTAAACIRPATVGDVCEVSYTVKVGDTVVDGVLEVAPPGAPPSDDSFYFVLGSAGSSATTSGSSTSLSSNNGNAAEGKCKGLALPPSWDKYSMTGMCVGEKRRIVMPPSLAFGSVGLSKNKSKSKVEVPPNTPLVIEVRLLSLNGVA